MQVRVPLAPTKTLKSADRAAETREPSRRVVAGYNILDNNGVNALMAFLMSMSGMIVAAWVFGFDLGNASGQAVPHLRSLLGYSGPSRDRGL